MTDREPLSPSSRMFLQQVRVENFRNLADVTVALQPGLNVIVGPNNVGKSNLLLAILHALGPAAARGEVMLWPTEDDLHCVDQDPPKSKAIRVTLTFGGLTASDQQTYHQFLELGPHGQLDSVNLRFESVWDPQRRRFTTSRWAGPDMGERPQIPQALLEIIPVAYLPALRDAEAALSPGSRSRVARLLEDYASDSREPANKHQITEIFTEANTRLNAHSLIKRITGRLNRVSKSVLRDEHRDVAIQASDPDFGRILRGLRMVIPGARLQDVSLNGLGTNNLLYITTTLAHLRDSPPDETALLLIEEPEAHLHPQMTAQLGEFFGGEITTVEPPQTIVTTHSPTLASRVRPSQVVVMHRDVDSDGNPCTVSRSLKNIGLTTDDERQLQRMMDITRAAAYFARSLILVEGVSEELLLPVLAKRLGYDLLTKQVSVIPLCGVAFPILAAILNDRGLGIRAAIVTDGDPGCEGEGWREEVPCRDAAGKFLVSPRVTKLVELCAENANVRVFHSDVTLEYDLAAAGPSNPALMSEIWRTYHPDGRTLKSEDIASSAPEERALLIWRGICRSNHVASKAGYAHALADWLSQTNTVETDDFAVPAYLIAAFAWACPKEGVALEGATAQDG